jgi:hypothetical protein
MLTICKCKIHTCCPLNTLWCSPKMLVGSVVGTPEVEVEEEEDGGGLA